MNKLFAGIRRLFFTARVIITAVVAPVVLVAKKAFTGQPITGGQLGFAVWRLLVWVTFLLCAGGSIGVPTTIAYLFMVDLIFVGFTIVSYAQI